MLAIYKREVRSYFNSMIGCVFAAFLTIIGGVYFMVYNLYSGYPFFAYSLAGVIFMLLISVPVLSMKSFAEDRKNKTDQLLLTSPVSHLTEQFRNMWTISGIWIRLLLERNNMFALTP